MKKINKAVILMIVLAVIPIVITAFVFDMLPDKVPTHWGLHGDITYGNKNSLWFLSCLPAIIAVLIKFMPSIDPRKKNYASFQGFYDAFTVFLMLFLTGILLITVSESLNPGKISVSTVVVAGIGLLYAFVGNMMPKIKSNFFMGIKTPWTLSDTEVWNKTHRLGGFLWFIGGISSIISAFLLTDTALFATFMAVTLIITIIPIVMSYIWYKKQQK